MNVLALKKEKQMNKNLQEQIYLLQDELEEKVKENRLHSVQIKKMM